MGATRSGRHVLRTILSREIDVSKYGVIFAGAKRTSALGRPDPAWIVREDLLGHALPDLPVAFDWKIVADHDSMYNHAAHLRIILAGLVFAHLKRTRGGVGATSSPA